MSSMDVIHGWIWRITDMDGAKIYFYVSYIRAVKYLILFLDVDLLSFFLKNTANNMEERVSLGLVGGKVGSFLTFKRSSLY